MNWDIGIVTHVLLVLLITWVAVLTRSVRKLERAEQEQRLAWVRDLEEKNRQKKPRPKWYGDPCVRCSTDVPLWFRETFGGESICRNCTEGMPYPREDEDEDMYVERYKQWRKENKGQEKKA